MSHRRVWFLTSLIGAAFAASGGSTFAQIPVFTDQTAAAGLVASHATPWISEPTMMTGGGAVGDFNRDGWQDVFFLGGPQGVDRLFINNGDGTFSDAAAAWGVARQHWGVAVAVGDYNRDGWLDLYVTSGGAAGLSCLHILYRNNGNGTFTDTALASGVRDTTAGAGLDGFGAAWGDYDLDGWLDLAVAGWIYRSGGNRLFRNNGNGTFTDVTASLGVSMEYVRGFSPRFVDMNGDRSPELLWTADFGTSRYFVNDGNGTFTESTAASGVGLDGNGMGATIGDFNADGRPDWYVTSITTQQQGHPSVPGTGNMLYLNMGGHQYVEHSAAAGVKSGGWGWGTAAVDLRNMGRQDLVATNGWAGPNFNGEFLMDQTCVFLNDGAMTFASAAPGCGVTHTGQGRGLVTFDADNDGDQDLLIFTNNGPLTYYRNDTPSSANGYLRIDLRARGVVGAAPDGYGAHVTVRTGPIVQHRWVCGGSNYVSQGELAAHFGLGAATIADEVRVEWPNGHITLHSGVAINRTVTIRACPADVNDDGGVSVQDIFDFLSAYFGGGSGGDHDLSGSATVQDIFDYLGDYFTGC